MLDSDQGQKENSVSLPIVIRDPGSNSPDNLIDYSRKHPEVLNLLRSNFHDLDITPDKYPRAADLYAGNGAVSLMLVEQGWSPGNLTAIDQLRPLEPGVPGESWHYWNLGQLGISHELHTQLPLEVEKFRASYNLAIALQSHEDPRYLSYLMDFLVKVGGYAYLDGNEMDSRLISSGTWRPVKGFLYQKVK